jgi:hypothetical protein
MSIGISHIDTNVQLLKHPGPNNTIPISTPPVVTLSRDEFARASLDLSCGDRQSIPHQFGLVTLRILHVQKAFGNSFRLFSKSNSPTPQNVPPLFIM